MDAFVAFVEFVFRSGIKFEFEKSDIGSPRLETFVNFCAIFATFTIFALSVLPFWLCWTFKLTLSAEAFIDDVLQLLQDHKAAHSKEYMKKLKLWKAKMMSKKMTNQKPSFKTHHANKMRP